MIATRTRGTTVSGLSSEMQAPPSGYCSYGCCSPGIVTHGSLRSGAGNCRWTIRYTASAKRLAGNILTQDRLGRIAVALRATDYHGRRGPPESFF